MKIVVGRDDLATAALRAAEASGVALERLDVRPVHKASHGFVNDGTVDVCEVAVVTLLQAVAYDRPVVLLPVTTLGRYQHQTLVTLGPGTVDDIAGTRVGVRSWSQTTGVWVRSFLTEQYGIDLRTVDWIVYERSHVDGYRDPSWVAAAPAGARLPSDFLDGRIDYAILGNELPDDDRIRTAIADPAGVAARWAAAQGYAPINHVLAVGVPAAQAHADAVCAMYDRMREAIAAGPAEMNPVGFEALRAPVSAAARYALEQQILPRPVAFDELVARSCEALGVPASRLGGADEPVRSGE